MRDPNAFSLQFHNFVWFKSTLRFWVHVGCFLGSQYCKASFSTQFYGRVLSCSHSSHWSFQNSSTFWVWKWALTCCFVICIVSSLSYFLIRFPFIWMWCSVRVVLFLTFQFPFFGINTDLTLLTSSVTVFSLHLYIWEYFLKSFIKTVQ